MSRAYPAGREVFSMMKMLVTGAIISKGFNGAEAMRYSDNTETPSVRFRVGSRVYDKRAENNYRYVNISVKAFNGTVSRIRDMKLDAGTYVNISGRYDEDSWEDQNTHEKKTAPVLIVDEIEYSYGNKQNGDSGTPAVSNGTPKQTAPPATNNRAPIPSAPSNFTGFEGFGAANPYFPAG